MNRKQFVLTLVVAMIAGLIGGGLSNLLFRSEPVGAQKDLQIPKVVEAQEFRLVDQTGKNHAVLSMDEDGSPRLSFFDQAGEMRIWLYVDKDGTPHLSFWDQAGEMRIWLLVGKDGIPSLNFRDQTGKMRIWLLVGKDGIPSLNFLDQTGKIIWEAP